MIPWFAKGTVVKNRPFLNIPAIFLFKEVNLYTVKQLSRMADRTKY